VQKTHREVDGEVGAVEQDDPALHQVLVGHDSRRVGAEAGLRRRRLLSIAASFPATEKPKHFADCVRRNPRQPRSTWRQTHPAMLH